MLYNTE